MLDYEPFYGYDQLKGDWLTYYKLASRFANKAFAQERQDLLHDIILTLARANQHKPMSMPAMYRTAEHCKDHYWFRHYKITSGLDCGHCSKAQRRKCREDDLYSECPKAIKLESLNKPILDNDGNMTELGELIADDKAIDLDQWLDIRIFLLNAPLRLKQIASKIRDEQPLTGAERKYLAKLRKRNQKALF
jgi:hypothetical protein